MLRPRYASRITVLALVSALAMIPTGRRTAPASPSSPTSTARARSTSSIPTAPDSPGSRKVPLDDVFGEAAVLAEDGDIGHAFLNR